MFLISARPISWKLGVYTDGITSTPVKIPFEYSIKSVGETVTAPASDVYSQLVQMISDGAVKGPAGHTPVRGADYWTEADIASIQDYCEEMSLEGKR